MLFCLAGLLPLSSSNNYDQIKMKPEQQRMLRGSLLAPALLHLAEDKLGNLRDDLGIHALDLPSDF